MNTKDVPGRYVRMDVSTFMYGWIFRVSQDIVPLDGAANKPKNCSSLVRTTCSLSFSMMKMIARMNDHSSGGQEGLSDQRFDLLLEISLQRVRR